MSFLVDGSNLLGRMGWPRESTESKRRIVQLLASFARRRRVRLTCVFDGAIPSGFACSLGQVTVVFASPRSADEVIAARASSAQAATVVTSDRGLEAKVRSRRVKVMTAEELRADLEAARGESEAGEEDWESYFSDSKNRNVF